MRWWCRPPSILVRTRAASLNFADVMRGMGFFLADSVGRVRLGTECAGEVLAVGAAVSNLVPGDMVACIAQDCVASHVIAKADHAFALPSHWPCWEAAALPTAYMTAWYALVHLARVQAGQTILIHSAAGGTGLAAVAVAKKFGLQIFVSASTEAKRQHLLAAGATYVMDSRSLSFESEIRELTAGVGVDIVLNSLAGDAQEASLRVLAADGHFLELGKRDIYADGQVSLAHFKRRITFSAVDLAGLQADRPQRFCALFRQVMGRVVAGELPPLPVERFGVAQAPEALAHLRSGAHVGKVVVELAPGEGIEVELGSAGLFVADGCYLISGGTGGLGLRLAQWLVARGVRDLVLVSRRQPSEPVQSVLAQLRRSGAAVATEAVDVGNLKDTQALIGRLRATGRRVRGVFHLAAVLRDGLLSNQDWGRFAEVFPPKALGAFHLHLATRDEPLDHFVMYSSAAALLPGGAQANYAAANAFLDGLASQRASEGLPALSINWGPFREVGLAAGDNAAVERLARQGLEAIDPETSHEVLEQLLSGVRARAAVVGLQPTTWFGAHDYALAVPLYEKLGDTDQRRGDQVDVAQQLRRLPLQLRQELLRKTINACLAIVLHLDAEETPVDMPFVELGVSSLTALELRSRLAVALGVRLPDKVLWTCPTVSLLERFVLERIEAEVGAAKEHSNPGK